MITLETNVIARELQAGDFVGSRRIKTVSMKEKWLHVQFEGDKRALRFRPDDLVPITRPIPTLEEADEKALERRRRNVYEWCRDQVLQDVKAEFIKHVEKWGLTYAIEQSERYVKAAREREIALNILHVCGSGVPIDDACGVVLKREGERLAYASVNNSSSQFHNAVQAAELEITLKVVHDEFHRLAR